MVKVGLAECTTSGHKMTKHGGGAYDEDWVWRSDEDLEALDNQILEGWDNDLRDVLERVVGPMSALSLVNPLHVVNT